MTNELNDIQRTRALSRHLNANEKECIESNIIVRVNRISAEHTIAFCSVEQRRTGLLRRTCTVHELIRRAEKALAPLVGMGIVPLITVRHKSLFNITTKTARASRMPVDWIPNLWHWLGHPVGNRVFRTVPVPRDPFGWRHALSISRKK
ncbi:MAG: hypothetical protein ABI599_15900 [Flavobacteriales bacterium]